MSILLSKLPLQQRDSPRKPHPSQTGCNGISLVGYTKKLLVSQYSVRCTVVWSGNIGWSSLKCSLLSKNTSQPTARYISCQFPVCLVRFQANFGFCCLTQENAIAAAWGRPFAPWERAPFENAPLGFRYLHVIFKSGLAAQISSGTGIRQRVETAVSEAVLCGRVGTGRESWRDFH